MCGRTRRQCNRIKTSHITHNNSYSCLMDQLCADQAVNVVARLFFALQPIIISYEEILTDGFSVIIRDIS